MLVYDLHTTLVAIVLLHEKQGMRGNDVVLMNNEKLSNVILMQTNLAFQARNSVYYTILVRYEGAALCRRIGN